MLEPNRGQSILPAVGAFAEAVRHLVGIAVRVQEYAPPDDATADVLALGPHRQVELEGHMPVGHQESEG